MKSKVKNEYRDLDIDSLKKKADELDKRQKDLEFARYTKPGKNTREIRNVRKEISFILTVIREKELLHDK